MCLFLSKTVSIDDEVASLAAEAEKKRPEDRTEQEKVAILGKPRLGDIIEAQIRIKESKEFKVSSINWNFVPHCSNNPQPHFIVLII